MLGQRVPVVDNFNIQVLPVIEAGSAETFLVQSEPERSDEPEFAAYREAGAPHVPCILGNFWLVKNDIEGGCSIHHPSLASARARVKRAALPFACSGTRGPCKALRIGQTW